MDAFKMAANIPCSGMKLAWIINMTVLIETQITLQNTDLLL